MQTARQLSVSLVNKPGRLASLLAALSKEKVSLRALAVMDTGERGTLRIVPDDFDAAKDVIQRANFRFDVADVLLVETASQSGRFQNICERLALEHLNIDYAYMAFDTSGRAKGGMLAVFKVNSLAKAQKVLSENGTVNRRKPGRRPVHAR